MITYVNTVFVVNDGGAIVTSVGNITNGVPANANKFLILDVDKGIYVSSVSNVQRIKIGFITSKVAGGKPVVKWSNIINREDVRNFKKTDYKDDTEDCIYVDFNSINAGLLTEFAKGGKRIIVRLTFKDLPTRYRKWTESYEYITKVGDTEATIAAGIVDMINGQTKRARVTATQGTVTYSSGAFSSFASSSSGKAVKLEAMKYDDDDAVDTLNWANKVRFNANVYYTDPAAEGWESLNKHFPTGVKINKVPGETATSSWKLVRDREAQAMGYEGILNRGMGTWPIIKPAMTTVEGGKYSCATLEFENEYRAADDIFRKTKQTVELYGTYTAASGQTAASSTIDAIATQLAAFKNADRTQAIPYTAA